LPASPSWRSAARNRERRISDGNDVRAPRLAYLALEAPREGQASFTHVHEIIAGLERRGWEVTLYAPRYSGRWERPSLVRRIAEYAWLQLRLALRLGRVDALYIRAHFLAFPIALCARLRRVPTFHEINGSYEDLFVAYPPAVRLRRLFEFLQRRQFRLASGLIPVTELLGRWAAREAPSVPLRVISNGANTSLFRPEAARHRSGLPERYAVFFGGLTPWHGIGCMVDALEHGSWPRDLALVVIGDGPERPRLEAAARRNPALHVLGRLPYAEMPAIVAGALAGLVPITDPGGRSSTGVAPLKLFETLACSVPAIVSDLPGQAEFVRRVACGLVFPVGDAAALAAAVAQLAADPEEARAMGARGAAVVRESESWERRAADTHDFLGAALRAGVSARPA
jgi:glycosyltransferase involved in cell wall biosynthesis